MGIPLYFLFRKGLRMREKMGNSLESIALFLGKRRKWDKIGNPLCIFLGQWGNGD